MGVRAADRIPSRQAKEDQVTRRTGRGGTRMGRVAMGVEGSMRVARSLRGRLGWGSLKQSRKYELPVESVNSANKEARVKN